MKILLTTFLLLTIALLTSCDPAAIMVIRAANKPNVSVAVYGNKKMLPHPGNDSQKVVIRIPPLEGKSKQDTIIFYGFGGWVGDKWTPALVNNIDSIIINNSKGKMVLNNRADITNYLLKHRSGFAKRILKIEAK